MKRFVYHEVVAQKNFYRDSYYRATRFLFFSLLLMGALTVLILYFFFTKPAVRYYASNSAGFVTTLNPRSGVNMSSKALLAPDPPEEANVKSFDL